ncbi:rhomboid family intramembrane serine protease [Aquihabitans daechungensis]|uniref:rhomboid family intramembrane serine protease n=1 Tax=Aquihabitans daechungensis TaxID=1052257 RepID=UPI003BA121A4
MSGRYAFSMPEPRQRDGWFKLGSLDMTTTNVVVGLGLASMVLYAISPEAFYEGAFVSSLVRNGEVWRLATWPLMNPPDIWVFIGLVFFWWVGHQVEDQIGRVAQAVLLAAMTVIPALLVTLLNVSNDGTGRWDAFSVSVSLLSLGLLCAFALDRPNMPFFFGIPAWVIAGIIVAIQALSLIGIRAWAQLLLGAFVILVACFGAAQRGMLADVEWIPRIKGLSGGPVSPYGVPGSAKPKTKRFGKGRSRGKAKGTAASGSSVVAGPWGAQPATGGPTPLEQAELDVLLDRISAGGIDSLTPHEKERLNALSKRMRDS